MTEPLIYEDRAKISYTAREIFNAAANHIRDFEKIPVAKHLSTEARNRGMFERMNLALKKGEVSGLEIFGPTVKIDTLEKFIVIAGLAKFGRIKDRNCLVPVLPPPSFPVAPS